MICKNDKILNAKIVNLSDAEAIAIDTSKVYEEDLKNIGKLFLSFATNGENVEKVLKDMNRHSEYKLKLKSIEKVIENINWIEPYRKKLFAHLIIYLIEIDDCDESTILDFENHPFFWDYNNIEEFIRIVSCRVDYNDKLKDKAIMKKRIRAINFEMESYDDWKKFIDVSIHKYIQTETYKKCELKCNELIKFIRNKIAHQDDDTDNEDFIPDPSEPSSSSPNRSDSPPSKKKKTAKDQKSLFDFFDKRGGPLNYFLYKFPDLLHDLYRYFRKYSNHKKVKQFYPNCFQYELPRIARKSFKSCSHAPVDTKSKNEALIYNERKSRQMEFSPKRKIL